MKLVWCPETASKAYIDAVKALAERKLEETNVAELVSAMAGGWKAQLIVEAWARGDGPAVSLGLAIAARHTKGRHVCVVPDERSGAEYAEAMRGEAVVEVVVGEVEEAMGGLEGVDFAVVDCRRRDVGRVAREVRAGPRGMVVVFRNAAARLQGSAAAMVVAAGKPMVRSAFLPMGRGLEIVHVGEGKGASFCGRSRWIKHVDRDTGEEHVFRR